MLWFRHTANASQISQKKQQANHTDAGLVAKNFGAGMKCIPREPVNDYAGDLVTLAVDGTRIFVVLLPFDGQLRTADRITERRFPMGTQFLERVGFLYAAYPDAKHEFLVAVGVVAVPDRKHQLP